MGFAAVSKRITEIINKLTSSQLVSLALIASSLFALLLYFYLSGLESKQVDMPQKLTYAVIAAVDISEKTIIEDSMLKTVTLPDELIPVDAMANTHTLVGKIAKVKILRGDTLTEQKVFANPAMAGFTGSIPPDKRAISVAITDITGISGFAKPGDFVDVMLITNKAQKNAITGTMLMQNVLLLAVNKDNSGADEKKDGKKDTMATATLAISPEDTLRLAVSQLEGTIYLVLRPLTPQHSIVITNDVSVVQHEASSEPVGQPASTGTALPNPSSPPVGIAVIRGNEVKMVEVQ